MTAQIVILRRRCPACNGRCYIALGYGPSSFPAPCMVCESLGIVSPKQAADWERQQAKWKKGVGQ